MATVRSFEELEIWKMARQLAKDVHLLYPESELFSHDFALKNQINRSSGSVMDNIAEGFERNGRKEFINFLSIAKGSCGEVKSQLHRALDRNYLSIEKFETLSVNAHNLGKKIGAFMTYLNGSNNNGSKFTNKQNLL
jgi:four helix bundle protein